MTTNSSAELSSGPWEAIHRDLGVEMPKLDCTSLSTHVERHAQSIPDNIALTYFDENISYSELNAHANKLANGLQAMDIGVGDVIGAHLPNIPQYVILLLAASKIGAAISSLSAMLAPAEAARQIDDANIKILISLDSLAQVTLTAIENLPKCLKAVIVTTADELIKPGKLESPEMERISCQSYTELVSGLDAEFQSADLPADHVHLIQYTGGTTGPSKGALIKQQSTMLNAEVSQVYCPWDLGGEIVASALPFFHVAGMVFLTISLRFGAHILLIPNPRDTGHFCQQMIDHPPTRIGAVPTLYQQIADHPLSKQIDFSKLKFAMTGSAPITGEDRARIERMLGGVVLSDSYGMTETGPAIVANPPDKCVPESVGIPLPGIDVRIVDVENGAEEMPYGEAGEIIVSTPCLMAGYLNRPEETAHAVREWKGKQWMHTGDVGMMDESGYVYILDRTKDMIIVSGFKVFSNEVENILASLESIAVCCLIGTPDSDRPGSEIVNLYVELTPAAKQRDADETREEILQFCKDNLARYKVPKLIHMLDEMPLTPVGKVNKKALRASMQ